MEATISAGCTIQVRQFEPFNYHISINGITAETPMEEVEQLCLTTIAHAAPIIGKCVYEQCKKKVKELRGE